jgi:Ran GTPase-activating protein (RanGAP) involved in mRNA processing and transport
MGPILSAIVHIPSLTELNLSQNEIGPISSEKLHNYLVSSTCTLKTLILNAADVDDFECAGFIDAVRQNTSLRELDLSGNLIGKSENLNTVLPDIITGSEAIADLLRSPECNLTKLHLQWNMIRLDGAIDLAQSLAINSTLTYLDLSFNSLSTGGGIVLGVSLLKNIRLHTLIISNNSIDARACLTICAGIIENRHLRKVVLDGNPIGVQVSRILFSFIVFLFCLHLFVRE